MSDLDDSIQITVVSFIDISAILLNVFFIFVITKRTPKDLSAYAILLLNIACVDFCTAFTSFMCIMRVMNVDSYIIFVHVGPCTLVHQQLCHFFLASHSELVGQSVYLLLISFICRLWMLTADSHIELSILHRRLWIAVILVMIISALNSIVFYLAISDDSPIYDVPSNRTISMLDLSGGLYDNIIPRAAVLIIIGTVSVGFVAIFITRQKLSTGLSLMTDDDQHGHRQIYRSLMAQMMLPLAHNAAASLWLLDAIGIVRSPLLQRSVYTLTSLFALVSPIINMHFIAPYRKYIRSLFSSRISKTKVTPLKSQSDSKL